MEVEVVRIKVENKILWDGVKSYLVFLALVLGVSLVIKVIFFIES